MIIWSGEIKELEKLYESVKVNLPALAKEIEQLINTEDANVVMLYSVKSGLIANNGDLFLLLRGLQNQWKLS